MHVMEPTTSYPQLWHNMRSMVLRCCLRGPLSHLTDCLQGLDSALTHALVTITDAHSKKSNRATVKPPAGYLNVGLLDVGLFQLQSLTLKGILRSLKWPEDKQRFGQNGFQLCLDTFADAAEQAMQDKRSDGTEFDQQSVYPHWKPYFAMIRESVLHHA